MNNKNDFISKKIISIKEIANIIKNDSKTYGLCHGGFDLLHPGHIKHFESASKLCNKLIVSITCDKYVEERKGINRPIFKENERAYMIASLEYVDFVIISPYKTGIEIIKNIKPNFYIKGPDYKNKATKGINQERLAINECGGQILYTDDEKFSTSILIDKIKQIERNSLLLILDRDGTIIEEKQFLGKEDNWQKNIILNRPVIDFIHFLLQHHNLTPIVISNQSGIAWKYFDEKRVIEINNIIDNKFKQEGINIRDWQFSPEVDIEYATMKGLNNFDSKYIKSQSSRKPTEIMVNNSLNKLKMNKIQFDKILVLGDRKDDELLAKNIGANFINVKDKMYPDIKNEFNSL